MNRTFAQRAVYSILRVVARLFFLAVYRIRCGGRQWIPRTGAVLVCANHQSTLDPIIVGLACNRRLNYLARRSLFESPWFSALIRFLDAIPIDREGIGLDGLRETLKRLRAGEMVLIFPEGTRTADGELQPIKPGFQAVAKRSGAVLLPVGIDGAHQVWPRDASFPRLGRLAVVFGPPIEREQIESLSPDQLTEELAARMADCHARARQMIGTRPVRRATAPSLATPAGPAPTGETPASARL